MSVMESENKKMDRHCYLRNEGYRKTVGLLYDCYGGKQIDLLKWNDIVSVYTYKFLLMFI